MLCCRPSIESGRPAVSSSSTESAALVDVTMPQMGVSVAEGTIIDWRKQVGDWVQADETIAEVSTDKIDTEIPSPAAGRVVEILVAIGTTVDVGATLARIATDARPGEPHDSEGRPPAEASEPQGDGAATRAAGATPASAAPDAEAARPARNRRYSPVVQRIAAEHGVELDAIEGTGRDGRVSKKDVMAYIEAQSDAAEASEPPLHIESPYRPDPTPPPVPGPEAAVTPSAPAGPAQPAADTAYVAPEGRSLSRMRQLIGQRMKSSLQTAATCTTWIEVDVSRVERARAATGTTALPAIARCVVGALGDFPQLNAWLENDVHTVHEQINLGIAVSLGDDGLIVPVVRSAQELSAQGLSRRIADLAQRARARELTPDDVQGATFTLTNPGQYGSIMATPIISQPQVAILDIEAITKRPVVVTDASGEDAIAIRPIVILGLSWDHRALDGALAARFLANIKRRMESYET
jgi:pyruvate/2-oxoglutarate dehydrogenase complex dihydrolipoamide acyltransferase (E2) component